jgi:uncharacterized protein (TIGR04255 family)
VRLSTKDELHVLLLNKNSVATSQLAPYPGWETFSQRVMRDLELFFDAFGNRELTRIGMRYINRIDVLLERADVSDYLNVWPLIPEIGTTIGHSYALQSTRELVGKNMAVTLQSATVDSPVPKAISFALDIDLFRTVDVPRRPEMIMHVLTSMRDAKNMIFEASITDKARELFS